ncbi:hypothetical protein EVJ33_04965 [Exiguobacterium sp. SL-10]|uniref:hypothetical protein n=1 Tax=unclassified Exiguobacterium TaxID=2644629 RepID=UPI00103D5D79|nr:MULTISPECIES: hypothetical protein [unclassified Exiguobacterium]TCI22936.1 hypothetical protein EVJ34_00530 [Exiguobacterium sp. SL-9]TCI30652.1 hypothetical protein EVJ33_04965 [Exiguobacterium sp. SL-10]
MNTIIDRFTSIQQVIDSLGTQVTKYNWMLTDVDGNIPDRHLHYFDDVREFEEGWVYWIKGEQLIQFVHMPDVYFIWGVFSGFDSKQYITFEQLDVYPFADGNAELWIESPHIQHRAAVCELILWDSSHVLLLSKNSELTEQFRKAHPDWRSLEEYNRTNELY